MGPIRRALRRPTTYWALTAVLAAATAFGVHQLTAEARQLQAAYGATTPVVVVTEAVGPGLALAPYTAVVDRPRALVPREAVVTLEPGAVSANAMTVGQVVTALDIASPGAARPGEAILAVPRSLTTPPVGPGTPVVFIVNGDALLGLEATLIDGRVVDITEDQVLVSVARAELTAASAAINTGTATLALSG